MGLRKRKMSLKDIEDAGWEMSEADKESVYARQFQIDLSKSVATTAESMARLANIAEATRQGQAVIMERLLAPKDWEFDVKRNKGGFISKVYAKQVVS